MAGISTICGSDGPAEFNEGIKELYSGNREFCYRKWGYEFGQLPEIHKNVTFICK